MDAVGPGEHGLYVWQDPAERWKILHTYVGEACGTSDQVAAMPWPESEREFTRRLRAEPACKQALKEGRVRFLSVDDFHGTHTKVTQAALRNRYRELLSEARADGYGGLRLHVDLGAYIERGALDARGLARIERANGRGFPFKFRLLCLLGRKTATRLGVEAFMRVVDSHTPGHVGYGGNVGT